MDADLAAEQEKILTYVRAVREPPLQQSVFTDFERNFPCVCFAVATGVGKTRLMEDEGVGFSRSISM